MKSEKVRFLISDIQNFQDVNSRTIEYYRKIHKNNKIDSGYPIAKKATFNNIWKNVSELERILQEKDIFEVITAWKIYEKIYSYDIKSELIDCSPLALELVTMIASSLQENSKTSKFYNLNYIINVWSLAHEVVWNLTSLYHCYQENENDLFERLAERYRYTSLSIRQNQYPAIRTRVEDSLLSRTLPDSLFKSIFKASWNDFKKIREAIHTTLYMKAEPVIQQAREGWDFPNYFNITHDDILQFDSSEISRKTGLEPAYIEEVLDNFVYCSTTLKNDLSELFDGKNPFIDKPLIKFKNKYMLTNINIGEDNILNLFESKMSQKDKQKYDKNTRSVVTEKMTGEIIEGILGSPKKSIRYFHEENYHYLYPKKDCDIYELGIDKSKADNEFEDCEGDHLYLYGNVLLIVEVKAKMYNPKTRMRDSKRLKSELKATIRNGDAQADRVEKIINANEGIWIKEGSKAKGYEWRDVSSIKRIYKMVVTLDGLGSLGLEVNEMFMSSLFSSNSKPLVISLYDLYTIKDTIEQPYNFIAYLELRRYLYEKNIKGKIFGFSEKDLYGFFLSSGLNKIIQRGLEGAEDIVIGDLDRNILKYYSELEKGKNQNLTIVDRSKYCKELSNNILAVGGDECLLLSSFISLLMKQDENKMMKSINKIKKSHFPSRNKRYFSITMDSFKIEILITGENEKINNYLRKRRTAGYDTYIIYFDSSGYVKRVSLVNKNKL
ncbi:hypothetical protein [Rothia dentocariosa]|uniref:hypothetical protein n=1 Tax=Rothia dentocariosa TaxID=2047 RepID=UPI000A54CA1E|nr:hypothetical protein [Rothia dentocariosa]